MRRSLSVGALTLGRLHRRPAPRVLAGLAWAGALLVLAPAVAASSVGAAASPRVATEPTPGDVTDTEYRVKAAFLFNFLRYTTWPPSAFTSRDAPIVVLVVGRDPFREHLREALKDKRFDGRAIELRHSRTVPDRMTAHAVFEGELDRIEQKKLLAVCKGRPTLLCGERPGYAALGAQCNFYIDDKNVRFEINVDTVKGSGLEMSAQLLKLARIVRNPD